MTGLRRLLLGLVAVLLPAPALAQEGLALFTPETVSISGDLRIVGVDGERGWLDEGFGKGRFGSDGDFRVTPQAVEGAIVWQPRFTWSLGATVVAVAQQGQEHAVDVSEAMVTFKPLMPGQTRVTARAGLFWPPVSLEHGHADWRVEETITPSAINSWIGEEVKVGALEGTVSTPVGGGRVAVTAAVFGLNDTAGTLLAYRGWALHDEKATAFGRQPLPHLAAYGPLFQALDTRPALETDRRPGWYAGAAWSPSAGLEVQALHYDNRGDPQAISRALQWGWRTTFNSVGAVAALGRLTLKAQGMTGRTVMGYLDLAPDRRWVHTHFRSAFLLATHALSHGTVSARAEAFGTTSRGTILLRDASEHGWALTGAVRREIGSHLSVLAEILHIDSTREGRREFGLAPRQRTDQVQLALRVHL